jgi:hypothetical protein
MNLVEEHYTHLPSSDTRRPGTAAAAAVAVAAGGLTLVAGAAVLDAARLFGGAQHAAVSRIGFGLTALAGLGLVLLPRAVRARLTRRPTRWFRVGEIACVVGLATASLVDLPSILDPDDTDLAGALGAPAIILASVGLLVMRRATADCLAGHPAVRRWLLLAGLWFFIQLPVNLALFIVPSGEPSFLLLAGGFGAAVAACALSLRPPLEGWGDVDLRGHRAVRHRPARRR